jgi:hypothetical protein
MYPHLVEISNMETSASTLRHGHLFTTAPAMELPFRLVRVCGMGCHQPDIVRLQGTRGSWLEHLHGREAV